jgi:crotonobetainyl-CoA:carnitine CoA-transferase CaiB-like acyl-CoA transferase
MDNLHPLIEVTVVECCVNVAGSYAGKVLKDLGADVIKVESPSDGRDALRRQAPLLRLTPPVGSMFAFLNGGKTSITLNVGCTSGRNLFDELVSQADVLLYDWSLDDRQQHRVESATLRQQFPDLIVASLLPYGEYGPRSSVPGTSANVFQSSGEGALLPNGLTYQLYPDRAPLSAYGDTGAVQAGIGAATAILAAVFGPTSGQILDMAEQDLNVALSGMTLQRYGDGVLETRAVRSYAYGGVFECRDGFVEVLAVEDRQWHALVEMLGRPAWALDVRLDDAAERAKVGAMINDQLRSWTRDRRTEEVLALGQEVGVPIGAYASPSDVLNSAHEASRNFFLPLAVDGQPHYRGPALPFRFLPDKRPFGGGDPPVVKGEDNEDVFVGRLGHSREDLERWICTGVV